MSEYKELWMSGQLANATPRSAGAKEEATATLPKSCCGASTFFYFMCVSSCKHTYIVRDPCLINQ